VAITLKALRYFLGAVERKSIAAAAEELAVVPSAVSAAIDSIEERLDLTLVHRRRAKGIEPTASGLVIAARARLLIEDYESLLSTGAELQGQLSGSLSIGYYAPVAPAFLPSILAPLLKENPGIAAHLVECDTARAQQGLLGGEFDAILFVADTPPPGVEIVPLIEAMPYVLVSADDPVAGEARATLDMLRDAPVVMLDLPVVRGYYDRIFDRAGIMPRIAATGATHEMVRSLVGAGVGRAILNMAPHADRTYAGDQVVAMPLGIDAPPLTLSLGLIGGRRRRVVDTFAKACEDFFVTPAAQSLVIDPQSRG